MRDESSPARSRRYSAIKTRLFIADLALTFISLVFFQAFISRPLLRMISGASLNFYVSCLFFSIALLVIIYAVSFPLRVAGSFFVERAFALSRQTFGAWLADEAKSALLSVVLSLACIQVFYLVLRSFPSVWWLISASAWVVFSVVLAAILPVAVIPLFFRYLPIEDSGLKERIMALAEKARINLVDVCRIDFSRKTVKANAALVGLGRTRKVILADTLTDNFSPGEVDTVVAHEFAHFKYGHMWQLIAFAGIETLAGFLLLFLAAGRIVSLTGATGMTDLYLLPFLMLLAAAGGVVALPVNNLFSRVLERQADRYALSITGDADNFISMMKKLAAMNLADTEPSPLKKIFLYDHPPVGERVRMAERFKEKG